MRSIKLQDLLSNFDWTESFTMYRDIEDWCLDNIPRERWRFDYSSTICVCGVDIPARIFFWVEKDAVAFKLRFGSA
jgi:hypothetical protein